MRSSTTSTVYPPILLAWTCFHSPCFTNCDPTNPIPQRPRPLVAQRRHQPRTANHRSTADLSLLPVRRPTSYPGPLLFIITSDRRSSSGKGKIQRRRRRPPTLLFPNKSEADPTPVQPSPSSLAYTECAAPDSWQWVVRTFITDGIGSFKFLHLSFRAKSMGRLGCSRLDC